MLTNKARAAGNEDLHQCRPVPSMHGMQFLNTVFELPCVPYVVKMGLKHRIYYIQGCMKVAE